MTRRPVSPVEFSCQAAPAAGAPICLDRASTVCYSYQRPVNSCRCSVNISLIIVRSAEDLLLPFSSYQPSSERLDTVGINHGHAEEARVRHRWRSAGKASKATATAAAAAAATTAAELGRDSGQDAGKQRAFPVSAKQTTVTDHGSRRVQQATSVPRLVQL